MLKIYFSQNDADRFFRSQYGEISESCLIQFNEDEDSPQSGAMAWFCKAGGEKIVSTEKGCSYKLDKGKVSFRTIEQGSAFLSEGQLYNFGHKGNISRPPIIYSSELLKKAYGLNRLPKKVKERTVVIKRRDNGEIINYAFVLYEKGHDILSNCYAFQNETCFYNKENHLLETLSSGHQFEFIGKKFYTFSPAANQIAIAHNESE